MKRIRQISFALSLSLLVGIASAQSLPEIVRVSAASVSNRPHAKRVITNEDIPAAPATDRALATTPAPAESPQREKEGQTPEAQEVCRYVAALRAEKQLLERRIEKLQQAIAREESEQLRTVYTNAVLHLNDSLQLKQLELFDAGRTPEGSSCQEPQEPAKPTPSSASENH